MLPEVAYEREAPVQFTLNQDNGKAVNADAIGAQVRTRLSEEILTRQVEGATGEGNQSDQVLHFGLGAHASAVTMTIQWPDGTTQKLTAEADQSIVVKYVSEAPRPDK